MTDADVRKRCEEWVSKQGLMEYDFVGNGGWEPTDTLVELVKTAYADGLRTGMEKAADRMLNAWVQFSVDWFKAVTKQEVLRDAFKQVSEQIRHAAGEGQ